MECAMIKYNVHSNVYHVIIFKQILVTLRWDLNIVLPHQVKVDLEVMATKKLLHTSQFSRTGTSPSDAVQYRA